MSEKIEDYLGDLYNAIKNHQIDPNNLIEYQLLNILSSNNSGMTPSEIYSSLDTEDLIHQAIKRLVDADILIESSGLYLIKPESSTNELLSENENEILTNADMFEDSSNDVASVSETRNTVRTSRSFSKATDDSFTPRESSTRARIREQALRGQSSSSKSANDDLDMDSVFDDALGESIEDFVSDFSDLIIEETKDETGAIEPLIEMLRATNYLGKDDDPNESNEYKVLVMILENYPISADTIEEKSDVDSLSLILSNLKADDLIDQTNDYQYTITKKVYKVLKDRISSKQEQPAVDKDREMFQEYINKPRLQFISACLALGYVNKPDRGFDYYTSIPEFEVLNIIREHEPISSDKIKNFVDKTLPVVVSRMLSKLHADEVITTDMNGNYNTSTKLDFYMVKDQLMEIMGEDQYLELENKYS